MNCASIEEFYDKEVSGLSAQEQLLLASTILQRVTQPRREIAETPQGVAGLVRRQQEALRRVRGIVKEGDPLASIEHDDMLYGPLTP